MKRVSIKDGVLFKDFTAFHVAVLSALMEIRSLTAEYPQPVITSAYDGKHSDGSYHYSGRALDIRTKHYTPEQLKRFFLLLKEELGGWYDVILEKDHIHVELSRRALPSWLSD